LRRPTPLASRVRVRLAPSARRRRSSTLSSTLSTVVLNCATSICQQRRAVYGECSTEYTRGTQGGLNSTKIHATSVRRRRPQRHKRTSIAERSSHLHLRNRALSHSSTLAVHRAQ